MMCVHFESGCAFIIQLVPSLTFTNTIYSSFPAFSRKQKKKMERRKKDREREREMEREIERASERERICVFHRNKNDYAKSRTPAFVLGLLLLLYA
jgi:hypothetical protein